MFCPKCGTMYEGKACPNGCNNPANMQKPKKKPIYKEWWFWLIIVLLLFSILVNEDEENTKNDTSSNSILTSSETKMTYEEEIAQYKEIDFATLARNPDKYKGEKFKFTGEIVQVQEAVFGSTVEMRINITKNVSEYLDYVSWSDTIYATVDLPKESDRILEDDIITFYGTCDGQYSYTSVLGSTVSLPKIDIKYWHFENN